MLLVPIADIRDDLGFDDMTNINAAIQDALDVVEVELQSDLQTDFVAGVYVDTFFVEDTTGAGGSTQFRLSQGLVSGLTSVLVLDSLPGQEGSLSDTSYFEYLGINGQPANPNDITASVQLTANKGVVTSLAKRFRNQYVQITYTAGLFVDPADQNSYINTPNWLRQAAMSRAKMLLADNVIVTEAGVVLDKNFLGLTYNATIRRNMRYAPSALLPIGTSQVAGEPVLTPAYPAQLQFPLNAVTTYEAIHPYQGIPNVKILAQDGTPVVTDTGFGQGTVTLNFPSTFTGTLYLSPP